MIQLRTVLLALFLFAQSPAWAVGFGITRPAALGSEQQSYFERPDILQVEAREHPELRWQTWRQAHLEAAAAFLELYPTEHLYFLARDAELLYDAVRFISRDDPQALARLHLLNVSRANMRDEHLLEYLAQEGITPDRLRSDSAFQPIFIDTGFSGTIPRVIAERMPEDVRSRLKTHLLVSSNFSMPSLRSFLRPVNPAINGVSPSAMHGTIVGYEHIARATDRSDAYQQLGGEWHPTSSAYDLSSDGKVNANIALQYQEDLKSHLQSPEASATLQTRRELWRELRASWITLSEEDWTEFLRSKLENAGDARPQTEAVIRDFLEWDRLIGIFGHPNSPIISNTAIGLETESEVRLSNKTQLIAEYPQWASILENPDFHIPALLVSGQLETLGAILDVIDDHEIRHIALSTIAFKLDQPTVYALAQALVENIETKNWVAHLFYFNVTAHHPELLRLAIEKALPEQMHLFAQSVFSLSHWSSHPELLRLAIEKAPVNNLGAFANYVFRQPHWGYQPDLLRLAIERIPENLLPEFGGVFKDPWNEYPELFRVVIERISLINLHQLVTHVLSKDHWHGHPELLRLAIERSPPDRMRTFATHIFSDEHWSNHPELLKLAIEKAPPNHLSTFATDVFCYKAWTRHPELLRLALERASPEEVDAFSLVFKRGRWSDYPHFEALRAATQITDVERRRAYLREQIDVCEQQMLGGEGST